ncbi:MAG: winged helix-turn-helix transcriptional regulator [Candidatus Freyarchaeota archaeon]
MPREESSLDLRIIKYLLSSSKKTVPQISKALGEPPSTVEYRVKKLAEQGVLLVEVPKSSAFRKYGRKYYVNPAVKPKTKRTIFLMLLSAGLALSGFILIPSSPLTASLLLAPSSLIGAKYAIQNYLKERTNQAKIILANAKNLTARNRKIGNG